MISRKNVTTLAVAGTFMLTLMSGLSFAGDKTGMAAMADKAKEVGAMAESGSLAEMINLNSATPEMLSQIPGIGPKIGEAIAAYRDANGSFSQIADLLNVEGIDASLLEKIKPFLKL